MLRRENENVVSTEEQSLHYVLLGKGKNTSNRLHAAKHPQKYACGTTFEPHAIYPERQKKQKKPKTKQIISLIPMRFVYFPSFKYYFVFIGRFASLWGFLSFAFPEHVENEWAFFALNGFPGPEARFSNVAKLFG